MVRARVISQAAANVARLTDGVVSRDARGALRGYEECREDAEEGGLAGAIGSQERQGFALADLERYTGKRDGRWLLEWLEKSAPAAARGGKRLL